MFKTTTAKTPQEYLDLLVEPRRSEVEKLHDFIRKTVPGLKPYIMSGMIGYGKFHYRGKSGREGDWATIALASQKNYISLYVCAVVDGKYVAEGYKDKLPKASIGKSCIRFKKVEDIDLAIIAKILTIAAKNPGFSA